MAGKKKTKEQKLKEKQVDFSLDRFDRQTIFSLILGTVVTIVIGLLVFNYFTQLKRESVEQAASQGQAEKETEAKLESSEPGKSDLAELPTTHTVQAKESLWKLAQNYYNNGFFWVRIAKANNLKNPDRLAIGTQLEIPKVETESPSPKASDVTQAEKITGEHYVVQKGDDLCKIGRRAYGICSRGWDIAKANSLGNPNLIKTGQELLIPR